MNNKQISSKDLSYICDMFNWNLNIKKTCDEFSEKVNGDEELKEIINNFSLMHNENCNILVGVISNGK